MGVCSSIAGSSKHEDGFTKHRSEILSSDKRRAVIVNDKSSDGTLTEEKMRVIKSSKILIIGDNRIKVATACYISAYVKKNNLHVEVFVGTRDVLASKNSLMISFGVKVIRADMNSPETLLPAIRSSGADTVFLVSPNQKDRGAQTTSGIIACRRAQVGHVVVLSSTCVESAGESIFGEQCNQIESFIRTSRLSYTIVRIPILTDNYLSQLQSMSEYGIFYRPLPPTANRNSICVSDVGKALGNILLTPGSYGDKIISLNGPLTNCEMAAQAFTAAFGKPIIYEQVSYPSYNQTLLEAGLPEWQVKGITELFTMFERQDQFCLKSTKELEIILGCKPTTVFDLALSAVMRTVPRPSFDGEIFSPSTHSSSSHSSNKSVENNDKSDTAFYIDKKSGIQPYSNLNILRSVESSPSSSLSPAGIAGLLKITLCTLSPNAASARRPSKFSTEKDDDRTVDKTQEHNQIDLTRNLDLRYCILLDGIFTYLPPFMSNSVCLKTTAVGSMENRSTPLSGYVISKLSDIKLSLKGSKGESTTFMIETTCASECQRWLNVLNQHVEHVDNLAGSKWLF